MLEIRDLSVEYQKKQVLRNLTLTVEPGEIYCLIGRSGSGKSTVLNAVSGMLGTDGRITEGKIRFSGETLWAKGRYTPALRRVLGRGLASIFQQPDRSFDPLYTIGWQMREVMQVSGPVTKAEAKERGMLLFQQLHFTDPERVWRSYPHELSGGMCQRVAIAMALANRAELLLADEPTSALDVTIQAELVKLLREIAAKENLAILLVTHNMDVARAAADRIGLLREGSLYEEGVPEDAAVD